MFVLFRPGGSECLAQLLSSIRTFAEATGSRGLGLRDTRGGIDARIDSAARALQARSSTGRYPGTRANAPTQLYAPAIPTCLAQVRKSMPGTNFEEAFLWSISLASLGAQNGYGPKSPMESRRVDSGSNYEGSHRPISKHMYRYVDLSSEQSKVRFRPGLEP